MSVLWNGTCFFLLKCRNPVLCWNPVLSNTILCWNIEILFAVMPMFIIIIILFCSEWSTTFLLESGHLLFHWLRMCTLLPNPCIPLYSLFPVAMHFSLISEYLLPDSCHFSSENCLVISTMQKSGCHVLSVKVVWPLLPARYTPSNLGPRNLVSLSLASSWPRILLMDALPPSPLSF